MRLTVAGTGLVAPPHDDAAVLQSAVVVVSPVAFEDQRRHGQCLDQVNITKRARSANVKIAATSAGGKFAHSLVSSIALGGSSFGGVLLTD